MSRKHDRRIENWLKQDSLPLWASTGVDPEGGFVEKLRLDGSPDYDALKRVRVQARQIYTYSHAAVLGLAPQGVELARRSYDFVIKYATLPDGGYAHLLKRRGEIENPSRDSYDHAFLLLAFSWFYRASKDEAVLRTIERLAGFLDSVLKDPGGGYFENDKRTLPRWQNPHMHLLEAFLAAYDATRNKDYLARAKDLVGMFRTKFFDREHGALREYFTNAWTPAPGDQGQIAEPGHQCEWVWLLWRYSVLSGEPVLEEMYRLYDHAQRFGKDPNGLLIDYVSVAGAVRQRTKRCWPQTEGLKASLVMSALGKDGSDARADELVDLLFEYYLDRYVKGGWNDVVDENNRPIATHIPASTLYHVFVAFTEYLSVRGKSPT